MMGIREDATSNGVKHSHWTGSCQFISDGGGVRRLLAKLLNSY